MNESALVKRLNRALAPQGLRVKASRPGSSDHNFLGRYCVVTLNNVVDTKDIDIYAWANELGVASGPADN